ncbi:MAG: L-threonylcarbamoyladenylate synthase [Oscillospiraceae bacterium]|jgi:L-threonylcarbamoyladenylate synthase|nr:L-threonylcarbamoyladenylate synthase [Oscillospiraceae bacterium]
MTTLLLKPDERGLAQAAELLLAGEIVAIPTETVYGLAIRSDLGSDIYTVKGRPDDKPLSWLVHDLSAEELEPEILKLAERHVTVILPYLGKTQGFRIPANIFALELLKKLNQPLACTSANLSGKPPLTDAASVLREFNGKIAAVVDGGKCEIGVASAVVDFTVTPPIVLRYGAGLGDFS